MLKKRILQLSMIVTLLIVAFSLDGNAAEYRGKVIIDGVEYCGTVTSLGDMISDANGNLIVNPPWKFISKDGGTVINGTETLIISLKANQKVMNGIDLEIKFSYNTGINISSKKAVNFEIIDLSSGQIVKRGNNILNQNYVPDELPWTEMGYLIRVADGLETIRTLVFNISSEQLIIRPCD